MENQTPTPPAPIAIEQKKKGSFWSELITFVVIAVVIVLPFRMFVAEPYIVSGTSMFPTFDTGHYLIVDKLSYRFHKPARYDVIVMIYPADTTKDFIKRIVGLPGETVTIKNGQVSITSPSNPVPLILNQSFIQYPKNDDTMKVTLTDSQYFVMGDNRAGSFDSRYWGPLPAKDIIGYPILRLLPVNKIGFLPGAEKAD